MSLVRFSTFVSRFLWTSIDVVREEKFITRRSCKEEEIDKNGFLPFFVPLQTRVFYKIFFILSCQTYQKHSSGSVTHLNYRQQRSKILLKSLIK